MLAGVSSFAFMGTNSHLVICSGATTSSVAMAPPPGTTCSMWRRSRLWVAAEVRLMARSVQPAPGAAAFHADLASPRLAWLRDHVVGGRPIVPGAAFIEMALASLSLLVSETPESSVLLSLTEASIPSPLALAPLQNSSMTYAAAPPDLRCEIEYLSGRLRIVSTQQSARFSRRSIRGGQMRSPEVSIHLTAMVSAAAAGATVAPIMVDSTSRDAVGGRRKALKLLLLTLGFSMTQAIEPGVASAVASVGDRSSPVSDGLLVGPHLLDSSLQLGQVFAPSFEGGSVYVPSGLDALVFYPSRPPATLSDGLSSVAVAPRPALVSGSKEISSDYYMFSDPCLSGRTDAALCIQGMHARRMPIAAAATEAVAAAGVVAESGGIGGIQLAYRVDWMVEVPLGQRRDERPLSLQFASPKVMSNAPMLLAASMAALASLAATDPRGAELQATMPSDLTATPEAVSSLNSALFQGLLKTVAQEVPGVSFVASATSAFSVDSKAGVNIYLCTPPSVSGSIPKQPLGAVGAFGSRASDGCIVAPRLVPELRCPPPLGPYKLLPRPKGSLDCLSPAPLEAAGQAGEVPVAPGTVLVAVKACGINFRDVLNVLGMYPGDAGDPGSDCSGVVVRAGAGAGDLAPGAAVFGLTTGALGSHVLSSSETMVPLPPTVSFEDAAAAPTIQVRGGARQDLSL